MRSCYHLLYTALFTLCLTSGQALWPFTENHKEEEASKEALAVKRFKSVSCTELLNNLSLEEKIAQVFLVPFPSELVDEDLKADLKRLSIGNIILFKWSNGLETREQILNLTSKLSRAILFNTGIPAMIGADQEGGRVFTLKPLTHLPSPMTLGVIDNPSASFQFGKILGEEMLELGVNVCLGPCIDLANPNGTSIIGTRALHSQPEKVIEHGSQLIKGIQDSNVLTVIKHAPGHGSTLQDSHIELPRVDKSLEDLKKEDFLPFKGLAPLSDGIMSAHVVVPALDPSQCASTSMPILSNLIRDTWNFQGVIFSDSVTMAGVAPELTPEGVAKAAVAAFKAGNDCIIIGGVNHIQGVEDKHQVINLIEGCLDALKTAVVNGEVSEEQLNASVRRILEMKKKIKRPSFSFASGSQKLKNEAFSWNLSKKAIRTLSPSEIFSKVDTSLEGKRIGIKAPKVVYEQMQNSMSEGQVLNYVPEVNACYYSQQMLEDIGGMDTFIQGLKEKKNELDIVLFVVPPSQKSTWKMELIQRVTEIVPQSKLIILGIGHPRELYDLKLHTRYLTLLSFSQSPLSLLALSQTLNSSTTAPIYKIEPDAEAHKEHDHPTLEAL